MSTPASQPTRLLLRPAEAAGALGISRARLYELITTGEVESVKIGASRRIPAEALQRFVDARLAAARDT